jgi:hypothetical protein
MKTPIPTSDAAKLPLWRLIAAIAVLAAMVGVLLSLAPVYFEDYQLRQYMRSVVAAGSGNRTPDQTMQSAVLTRARQLDLPVLPDQIQISHANGRLQLQIKYAVQMDFALYQVNVHFHPSVGQ